MQARVLRSDVLASIAGCVIVYGNQAVQELVWALLQAQQATINVLDLVARDRPILDQAKYCHTGDVLLALIDTSRESSDS
jgi:hypothetical protein